MPKVSIIMPVYNGIHFIEESIQSILKQTFTDWEFIIINEQGSNDGSQEYIEYYASNDPRILLIQNTERLGLAKSLNVGLEVAKGTYIARVDVDDPSYPERLERQVNFLDSHPDITLCGAIQQSVTPTSKYVQPVSTDVETLRASMIFGCEISHCSVMFRKQYFMDHNLFYDPSVLAEDYDLWSKILFKTKIVNLNEVLVDHRWGFENISIQKGERLREESREISARILKEFNIDIKKENIDLRILSGWNQKPIDYAVSNPASFVKQSFHLLSLLRLKNSVLQKIDRNSMDEVIWRRWNWTCECCGIDYDKYVTYLTSPIIDDTVPLVSVILPVYNSVKYLRCAIDSIRKQTWKNWELILINEYGSEDGSREICRFYEWYDPRIHLIQNERKLGLGESLNYGFRQARGKYLARLDADDISRPDRLELQVNLMEKMTDIGICGSYQHHFGMSCDWVHRPAITPEQCRANLLFWCDLCHSTLMLRNEIVKKYNLYFDSSYLAEDFELWSRAVRVTKITNIPEILGEYRWGDDNITLSKIENLREESGHIVAHSLKENLHLTVPEERVFLLAGWGNLYQEEKNQEIREQYLEYLKQLLIDIYHANKKYHFYDEISLLTIMGSKWRWALKNESWHNLVPIYTIGQVFEDNVTLTFLQKTKIIFRENLSFHSRAKRIIKNALKPLIHPLASRFDARIWKAENSLNSQINSTSWKYSKKIIDQTDSRIWKAEKRIINLESSLAEINYINKCVQRYPGEKLRVAIIFQVASFWPSIDMFYQSCKSDERFDVKIICYDENFDSSIKTDTAREFLIKKEIEYYGYEDFDLSIFHPHVVILQTPYDTNRTQKFTSVWLKSQGYRVIYIPYGIEIAATKHAQEAHFNMDVVKNCWRLYTLSSTMYNDYVKNCTNSAAVRVMGLPKFDSLYYPEKFPLNPKIEMKALGRPIILWKVHFPKVISENGKNILVTPYISEYINFARKICSYSNAFFIFMPHPRFKEFNQDHKVQQELEQLMNILVKQENVYIDNQDDYRNSLVHANCIIVDRSAVMVEAAAVGVPILYMYNKDFDEPLTEAIRPLIDSYYHGTTCADIENFINMFMSGKDPLKDLRMKAFRQCIPFFDGQCGTRIKDDIFASIPVEYTYSSRELMDTAAVLEKKLDNLLSLVEANNQKVIHNCQELETTIDQNQNELKKILDSRIWKAESNLQQSVEELHTHIDFTYRDVLIVLEKQLKFVGNTGVRVLTDYPVAKESFDYLYPHGTIRDNTRYPRFIKKCEDIFKKEHELKFLDLGCSGGGMVLDAIIRGHLCVGLEGCDLSLIQQRAEWRLLRNNLFTCDITKPFKVINETTEQIVKFDVITAWEVLEHIQEHDLRVLFENVKNHLTPNGIFVASVADWDDIDPNTGVNWHCCIHVQSWWEEMAFSFGFECCKDCFSIYDMPRGGINPPIFYQKQNNIDVSKKSFSLVLKQRKIPVN